MTLSEAGIIMGMVVGFATMQSLVGRGIVWLVTNGKGKPGGDAITKEFCEAQRNHVHESITLLREDIGGIRHSVEELTRRVQNGDIANKLAAQVIEHIKEHERK